MRIGLGYMHALNAPNQALTLSEFPMSSAEFPSKPSADAIQEAAKQPNGWVYVVGGKFKDQVNVPPTAILGAWKVNAHGNITGEFIPNPNYKQPGGNL